jgi:hypothetical protein
MLMSAKNSHEHVNIIVLIQREVTDVVVCPDIGSTAGIVTNVEVDLSPS